MKKSWIKIYMSGMLISCFAILSAMNGKSGREIALLVDERPNGNDRITEMTMTLTNRNGKKRVREMISYSKDYGKDTRTLFVFRNPADVKGAAFLTWDYDNPSRDDDKWLYLPALKKEKRISGSSKNESFMGSDLTYDDMGKRSVDDDIHTYLRDENVGGYSCWVIESVPKNKDYIYSKVVSWIRKDAYIRINAEFYDRRGKLLKTMSAGDVRREGGFFVAFNTRVHNVQDDHHTVFEVKKAVFDSGLSDSMFTVASLSRGVLR